MKFISSATLLSTAAAFLSVFASAADLQSWKAFSESLRKDPSLVRLYVFEKPVGGVPNLAGNGAGTLLVKAREPYFNESLHPDFSLDFPRWTEGRFPGKAALSFRSAKDGAMSSQLYNSGSDALAFELWLRSRSEPGAKEQGILLSVDSGFGKGWFLSGSFYNLYLRLGRSKEEGGDIELNVPKPLTGGVWRHIAVSVEPGSAKLFLDGELVAEKAFADVWKQPASPGGSFLQTPEEDRGGLKIGCIRNPANTLFFDCDELAVFKRPLSAEEVKAHYQAGRPETPVEAQIAASKALAAKEDLAEAIELSLPGEFYGYLPRGAKIPLSVAIPAAKAEGLKWPLKLEASLRPLKGAALRSFEGSLEKGEQGAKLSLPIDIPQLCGLYFLDATLKDSSGAALKSYSFPIAATLPVAPMAERPESSPLGAHGGVNIWNEALALGIRHERDISPWRPKLKEGGFDWKAPDYYVDSTLALGMDMLFCEQAHSYDKAALDKVANGDPSDWEAWFRPLVERYKDKVQYWEVCNEPNARGCSPAQYVALLKSAHAIVRELAPKSKIVALCGVSDFPTWTEEVLARGGGAYFDILSFHNYIGGSPVEEWRKLDKIGRVKDSMRRHLGKELPIWNTESGIHQSWRPDGLPLDDDELLALYPRGRKADGHTLVPADAVTMATEHVGACWQMQSILLDCSLGVERFFTLMGASRFYPHYTGPTSGFPSEKGVAFAALASVIGDRKEISQIPLSTRNAVCVLVKSLKGRRVAALFAAKPLNCSFKAEPGRLYKAMDFLGNPLEFKAEGKVLSLPLAMEPLYVFDVQEDFAELPLAEFKNFPSTLSPLSAVDGSLDVSNPFASPLKATLSLSAPDVSFAFEERLELAPGETKSVPFKATAGPLKRGSHALVASLLKEGRELSRAELLFSSEGVAKKVPLADKPFKLDGDVSDWAAYPAEISDKAENVVIGRPPVGYFDANSWRGPKDLSFSVKTAWSPDDGLYFLLEVADDSLKSVPEDKVGSAFLQDSLELFFDGRLLKDQTPSYSFGAEQLVVRPSFEPEAKDCLLKSFAKNGESIDLSCVGRRTAAGYLIEGRLRPKPGSPFKLEPGVRFGLDFVVDDAAEETMSRRLQMALHGTAGNSGETSNFGRYQLSADSAAASEGRTLFSSEAKGQLAPKWSFSKSALSKLATEEAAKVEFSLQPDSSLRIEYRSKQPLHLWWEASAPASGAKPLQISFKAKAILNGKARYCYAAGILFFLGEKGAWLGYERIGGQPAGGSSDWGSFSKHAMAPNGTKTVGFRAEAFSSDLDGSAEFLFKDVELREY